MQTATTIPQAIAAFFRAIVPQPADVDVEAMALRTIAARPVERHVAHFRPSQINNPYACHRRAALMRLEGIYTDRVKEDPAKIRIMNEGTLLHGYIQTELLGPTGALFGHWRCKSCRRTIHRFCVTPTDLCPNLFGVVDPQQPGDVLGEPCADTQRALLARGEAAWEYEELTVEHPELNLIGHVDGVLLDRTDLRLWRTLELKTTGPLSVRGVDEVPLRPEKHPGLPAALHNVPALLPSMFRLPKAYHVGQGALYSEMLLRMAAAGRVPLSPSGYRGTLVVYVDRDGMKMTGFMRHNSAAAMAAAQTTIDAINAVLAAADRAPRPDPVDDAKRVAANRTLACRLGASCRDRNDPQALRCPWRTVVCFPYKQAQKNRLEYLV